jgi:hypothetical protein
MSQGKGISEAVRGVVLEWLDDETIEQIAKALDPRQETSIYRSYMRNTDAWVRKARRKSPSGFTRTYRCNGLAPRLNVELEVRSNPSDTRINYYAFRVNGKFVVGGQASVASVNIGSNSRDRARIGPTEFAQLNTSIGSFRRMSEAELDKLNTEVRHGNDGAFDSLFEERSA